FEDQAFTDETHESRLMTRRERIEYPDTLSVGLIADRVNIGDRIQFLKIRITRHVGELVTESQVHSQLRMNLPGVLGETVICGTALRKGPQPDSSDRYIVREQVADKGVQVRPLKIATRARQKVSRGNDGPPLRAELEGVGTAYPAEIVHDLVDVVER